MKDNVISILMFLEGQMCARLWARFIMGMISFHPHIIHERGPILILILQMRKMGTERVSDLSKVTQQVGGKARI